MAVKGDGTVWTWGRGDSYQLCQYLTDPCLYATRANIYFDVVEVSAGEFHSMVLKNDGTVWCWGKNQYGQLGDGTRETSSFEVQAKGVYDYLQLQLKQATDIVWHLFWEAVFTHGVTTMRINSATGRSRVKIYLHPCPIQVALTINLEWKRFHAATA